MQRWLLGTLVVLAVCSLNLGSAAAALRSPVFPTTLGAMTPSYGGSGDAFVALVSGSGCEPAPSWAARTTMKATVWHGCDRRESRSPGARHRSTSGSATGLSCRGPSPWGMGSPAWDE